ncbi:hypothetical protein [Falsiroseomonas selenitidurans]|uniref:Uncharacterized protein n=1 Tax=Falsiroseomonas selenitidurans TaxID=2716335 RepID=A0ABX1E3K5_9PROT|nr:hypothetical protein [Falsiroseomonas selenitidurans]NKC31749.1 hypothetical protein [Falsiroseomonas selenitidurans]
MSTIALGFRPQAGKSSGIPADLRIPPRPRVVSRPVLPEPAWREAMRWSVIALTASLAAGEVALALWGP